MRKRPTPIACRSLNSAYKSPDIKNPLRTKNKSTPTHPTLVKIEKALEWWPMTNKTATQRRISSLLFLISLLRRLGSSTPAGELILVVSVFGGSASRIGLECLESSAAGRTSFRLGISMNGSLRPAQIGAANDLHSGHSNFASHKYFLLTLNC